MPWGDDDGVPLGLQGGPNHEGVIHDKLVRVRHRVLDQVGVPAKNNEENIQTPTRALGLSDARSTGLHGQNIMIACILIFNTKRSLYSGTDWWSLIGR